MTVVTPSLPSTIDDDAAVKGESMDNFVETATWTYQDSVEGRCSFWDVGHPRPPRPGDDDTHRPSPPITDLDLSKVPARRLKADVMAAYEELGGKAYLLSMAKTDPAQFNKLLTKILPQAIEADVRAELSYVSADIRNMTVDQLKMLVVRHLEQTTIDVTPTDSPSRKA